MENRDLTYADAPEEIVLQGEVLEEFMEYYNKQSVCLDFVTSEYSDVLDGPTDKLPPFHRSKEVQRYLSLAGAYRSLAWEVIYRYFPRAILANYSVDGKIIKEPTTVRLLKKPQDIISESLETLYTMFRNAENEGTDSL